LTGVSQAGAFAGVMIVPSARFSWNFTGMVLPPLKMLVAVPIWWAVSLIGCRNPSHP
jgi:hypothetical protein